MTEKQNEEKALEWRKGVGGEYNCNILIKSMV